MRGTANYRLRIYATLMLRRCNLVASLGWILSTSIKNANLSG